MPFGKHRGTRMQDVPSDYLLWLSDDLKKTPRRLVDDRTEVLDYVDRNRVALEQEVEEKRGHRDD